MGKRCGRVDAGGRQEIGQLLGQSFPINVLEDTAHSPNVHIVYAYDIQRIQGEPVSELSRDVAKGAQKVIG